MKEREGVYFVRSVACVFKSTFIFSLVISVSGANGCVQIPGNLQDLESYREREPRGELRGTEAGEGFTTPKRLGLSLGCGR